MPPSPTHENRLDMYIDRNYLFIKDYLPTKFEVPGEISVAQDVGYQLTYQPNGICKGNMPFLLQMGGGHKYSSVLISPDLN